MIKCRKCQRLLPLQMFENYRAHCFECKLKVAKIEFKNMQRELRLRRKAKTPWTDKRLRSLIRLYPLALGYEELARRVGVDEEACKLKARRLGLRMPRMDERQWTDDELYRLWYLRKVRDMSFTQAAVAMGYPNPTDDRNRLIGAWHRYIRGKEEKYELVLARRGAA